MVVRLASTFGSLPGDREAEVWQQTHRVVFLVLSL